MTAAGVTGVDFGMRGGRVTGRVWDGANADGVRQDDEAGLVDPIARVGVEGHYARWTQEADGTYVVDDIPAGYHGFYSQDAAINQVALAHSPGGVGDDPTRDSDFDRHGGGPVLGFAVVGDEVVAVDGPVTLADQDQRHGDGAVLGRGHGRPALLVLPGRRGLAKGLPAAERFLTTTTADGVRCGRHPPSCVRQPATPGSQGFCSPSGVDHQPSRQTRPSGSVSPSV
ncbi:MULTISPECIES: hypothetical protein [Actinosynnema]|uniref:hypothetical protein n=1 Tax=Actinosynnema TaxID=40566 RepID=UPI0020A381AE|nr:hypothetical protein [Actinosynnema pretiosum]MCP2098831.1 hypothetical protein [Actinosynnema pretiosum]